jgi:hypothetical protein
VWNGRDRVSARWLLPLAVAFAGGFVCRAVAAEPPVRAVVVIDLTKEGGQQQRHRAWTKPPVWVTDAPDQTRWDKLTEARDAFSEKKTLEAQKKFLSALADLRDAADPARIVSNAGDQVLLVLLADAKDEHEPVAVVKETKRLTQLAQDIQKLVTTVIQKMGKPLRNEDEPTVQVVLQTVTLTERRATLTIGARSVREEGDPATITEDSCKNGGCVQRAATITSGPVENFFLSLDLPVTKASDFVYDSTSGALQPKTTPTVVYLGLDAVPFGDVLTKPRSVGWSNVVVKGFIKLSSRPSDAFGFGLGFRPPALDLAGVNLNLFQVFGAWVWTREDRQPASGEKDPSSAYKGAFRAGVSFNLDRLADWLKL